MLKSVGKPTAAVLLMLLSTVLLACMHGLVRALGDELHPFVMVFFRNLFGLAVIAPLIVRNRFSVLKTDNVRLHALRAVVGIMAMLAFFTALTKVPIANVTALSFSTTLFATLTAALFLGEPIRARRLTAIGIGLLGVLIVLRPTMDGFNSYSLLVLCAAVTWGLSVTLVKLLTRTESSLTIVAWMSVTLTVLSLPPALWHWQLPSGMQLVILLCIGALATAGHLLIAEALKRSDVAIVMSVDFSRLIWTAIIGAWFFSEYIDRYTVIGAVIIFISGWYILFRESQLSDPQPIKESIKSSNL